MFDQNSNPSIPQQDLEGPCNGAADGSCAGSANGVGPATQDSLDRIGGVASSCGVVRQLGLALG